jgi:hypothetical protein
MTSMWLAVVLQVPMSITVAVVAAITQKVFSCISVPTVAPSPSENLPESAGV